MVQADKLLNLLDLLNICSVCLIYLGNLCFGVLTWRPCLPKKVATQSPRFNIIKEYTLDDANASLSVEQGDSNSEEISDRSGNVETNTLALKDVQLSESTPNTPTVVKAKTASTLKTDTTVPSKLASQSTSVGDHETSSMDHCKVTGIVAKSPTQAEAVPPKTDSSVSRSFSKHPQPALHVATKSEDISPKPSPDESLKPPSNAGQCTSQTNNDVHVKRVVTCPEDSLVLIHYPWKCKLNVKLDRIQPLEIDIWSNNLRNYHVFNIPKEVTPIISDVKGYGLRKRPIKVELQGDDLNEDKTDPLIDHAKALIDMAKSFVSKPVGHKQPRKQPIANLSNQRINPRP